MPDYVHAVYTSVKNTWQDAENLDNAHGYISYIWIPEETYKVDLMKLRIYAEKFRAHSKSALAGGGTTKTTSAGGGVKKTSEGGGAHEHSVTGVTSGPSSEETSEGGGAHEHSVTGVTSGPSSEETSEGGGAHSHSVTGVTSSTESAKIKGLEVSGELQTGYMFSSSERTTSGPSATATIQVPNLGVCPNGHPYCQFKDSTTHHPASSAHTHEVPSLRSFTFPESGDYAWFADADHTHSVSGQTATAVGTHTHGIAHTHSVSGQTATAVGTHTHGIAHTHSVSGQTATAVGTHTHEVILDDHTHEVTLEDHTHDIDFGIYEEAITGRTLSAVLYDPDGNVLKDFGVILTGEDSDILDLTDYFETLKYGMYKVVLSASGRLRTRLVFYELCKMYAQY
jgi:hypothetical protein